MRLHISLKARLGLVLVTAFAVAVFVYLMGQFGGPALRFHQPYRVSITVPDSQGLAKRSDVLVRGVKVGQVASLSTRRPSGPGSERTRLTLEIERRYAPVDRDATVRVGQKTLLGESYVDLDLGHRAAGRIGDGGELPPTAARRSVEIDEALEALGPATRSRMRSVLRTTARGASSPATSPRLRATLRELDGLTGNVRRLAGELHGQEGNIAGGVTDTRLVLREIGSRDTAVRSIVSAGNRTLAAVAGQDRSLQAGLVELPRLLAVGRRTLTDARPLLTEARPLVRDLGAAAPDLSSAARDLRPVAADLDTVLAGLPALRRSAVPFIADALPVLRRARPVARALTPALANVVPAVRYLSARRQSVTSWFSNTSAIGDHGDAKGDWARFFLFAEPGTFTGTPGSFSSNAYPGPGDAADNKPFVRGTYPRLRPFRPR